MLRHLLCMLMIYDYNYTCLLNAQSSETDVICPIGQSISMFAQYAKPTDKIRDGKYFQFNHKCRIIQPPSCLMSCEWGRSGCRSSRFWNKSDGDRVYAAGYSIYDTNGTFNGSIYCCESALSIVNDDCYWITVPIDKPYKVKTKKRIHLVGDMRIFQVYNDINVQLEVCSYTVPPAPCDVDIKNENENPSEQDGGDQGTNEAVNDEGVVGTAVGVGAGVGVGVGAGVGVGVGAGLGGTGLVVAVKMPTLCAKLADVANGVITYTQTFKEGILSGGTATLQCDSLHSPDSTGSSPLTCDSGQWQPAMLPSCISFVQSCNDLAPNSLYDQGVCFVISPSEVLYDDATCPTNELGKGDLAFISGQRILDVLAPFISGVTLGVHIGLKQFDLSREPKGGWYWWDSEGNKWDATNDPLWCCGEPNDWNGADTGCLADLDTRPGLQDCPPMARHALCQYVATNSPFRKKRHIRAVPGSQTLIRESIEAHEGKCVGLCMQTALCRSFSYARSTQRCQLHSVDMEDLIGEGVEQDRTWFGRM